MLFDPDPTPEKETDILVLSRKIGETIHIGDNIVVTITGIDRGKIRVGIECPREIKIVRGELLTAAPKTPTPAEDA